MGGLANGRAASTIAVRTALKEYMAKVPAESVPDALARSVAQANTAVNEMAKRASMDGDVGTTLSAAVVHDGNLYWFSAGDSRIYLYRDGELSQVTIDHNYGLELDEKVAQGELSREEAANNPERGHLISFLGLSELPLFDNNRKPFPLKPNDRILLCSDGLYGTLSEVEIAEEMACSPHTAAERLVEKALGKKKQFQDNITVLISAYEPVIRKMPSRKRVPWKRVLSALIFVLAIGSAGFLLGRNTSFSSSLMPHLWKAPEKKMLPAKAATAKGTDLKPKPVAKPQPTNSTQASEKRK
jgi:protein phosphatase